MVVLHKMGKQVVEEEVLPVMVHLITIPMVEVELVYMDKVLMVKEVDLQETHILITPLISVAMMDPETACQGRDLPPRKKSLIVDWLPFRRCPTQVVSSK